MEYEMGLVLVIVLVVFGLICIYSMYRSAERRAEAAEADAKALATTARKADDYLRLNRQAWLQINERDELIAELRQALRRKEAVLEQYRKQIEREA